MAHVPQVPSREKMAVTIAALLLTLSDFDEPVPAGPVYVGLDCDMALYRSIVNTLERGGYLKATSTTLGLTAAGYALAVQVNAALRQD